MGENKKENGKSKKVAEGKCCDCGHYRKTSCPHPGTGLLGTPPKDCTEKGLF